MPLVGFEVFGSVVADQPGEASQHCSDDEFDYSDHSWFLYSGSVTNLWLHDVNVSKSNRYKVAE
jgi:hypothetical protein